MEAAERRAIPIGVKQGDQPKMLGDGGGNDNKAGGVDQQQPTTPGGAKKKKTSEKWADSAMMHSLGGII